jgi:hypothetical protein
VDTHNDGIGNNADTDDDNDGVLDADDPAPLDPSVPGQQGGTGDENTLRGSSSDNTAKVDSATTSKQASALEILSSAKGRKVLVRGRILVKARKSLAKASAACKAGGKVLVTVKKGSVVVGKRQVKLGRTCSFRAPITLAKGTTGKLKVEVKFLGNRALRPTKRTTSLQVNG